MRSLPALKNTMRDRPFSSLLNRPARRFSGVLTLAWLLAGLLCGLLAVPCAWSAPPPHHYVYARQDGWFGYEPALSPDDENQGLATAPLVMARVLQMTSKVLIFVVQDPEGGAARVQCVQPCKFADLFDGGRLTTVRVAPGSILQWVIDDAKHGYLPPLQGMLPKPVPLPAPQSTLAPTPTPQLALQPTPAAPRSPSAGASAATPSTAPVSQPPLPTYADLLKRFVSDRLLASPLDWDSIPGDPRVTLQVALDMNTGAVQSVEVLHASGSSTWDDFTRKVISGIDRFPSDHGRWYSPIVLVLGPREMRASSLAPASAQPEAGPSFNCKKAFYADEKAICASPQLSALDRQLAALYGRVKATSADPAALAHQSLLAVIARRKCGSNAQCIAQWDAERTKQLGAQLRPSF